MSRGRDTPDREDRRQRKLLALEDRNARCYVCGYDQPSGLERHHIAGRKHDEGTIVVCRNCHSYLSDRQFDHTPLKRPQPRNDLATIAFALKGICDAIELLLDRCRGLADGLIELAEKRGK
jgi:hypothetical protein